MLLKYINDTAYRQPEYCSISGFKIEEKYLEEVYSNYKGHVRDLLRGNNGEVGEGPKDAAEAREEGQKAGKTIEYDDGDSYDS